MCLLITNSLCCKDNTIYEVIAISITEILIAVKHFCLLFAVNDRRFPNYFVIKRKRILKQSQALRKVCAASDYVGISFAMVAQENTCRGGRVLCM